MIIKNHYYISLKYITDKGNVGKVADHADSIASVAGREESGKQKVGKTVGFGPHRDEVVVDYNVSVPEFKGQSPSLKIRINSDAKGQYIKALQVGRHPGSRYTEDERKQMDLFEQLQGKEVEVMADVCVPQWSTEQFYNTMPIGDAKAGYAIRKQYCEVIG